VSCFAQGGRESFSENASSMWLVVARKRLPTPFASREQNGTAGFSGHRDSATIPVGSQHRVVQPFWVRGIRVGSRSSRNSTVTRFSAVCCRRSKNGSGRLRRCRPATNAPIPIPCDPRVVCHGLARRCPGDIPRNRVGRGSRRPWILGVCLLPSFPSRRPGRGLFGAGDLRLLARALVSRRLTPSSGIAPSHGAATISK
jgi:hypothetical protein